MTTEISVMYGSEKDNKKETQQHFMDSFSKYFSCFKKLKHTTYCLVIEDEYLPVILTWVTHSSAYDPFLYAAMPKRVDPRSHPLTDVTLSAPMPNLSE